MNQPESSFRIKSIKVTGLFGLYDHQVTLTRERVTVIHGPNGVGKTVFLKLTEAFLRGRYHEISRIPFDAFKITFEDNSFASIQLEGNSDSSRKILLEFKPPEGNITTTILEGSLSNTQHLAEEVANSVPFLLRTGSGEWLDRRTDEVLNADEIIAQAYDIAPKIIQKWTNQEPSGLRNLRSRINVHFIEAQRLIRLSNIAQDWRYRPLSDARQQITQTVKAYSNDLKSRLKNASENYGNQAQKLDQTFAQRLLQQKTESLTIEQLKNQMDEVKATQYRLKKMGILDSADLAQSENEIQTREFATLEPIELSVLSMSTSDTKEKLAVLEELSKSVDIFLQVLNKKFTNKKIVLSRESGLAIFDKNQAPIPITALSSGEQHELVLLYDLLFKVKPDTLVLIDEPELSLHISWQKDFMDDLLAIIKLAKFDVIMTTHSPFIVGDHSNLLVMLSPETEH